MSEGLTVALHKSDFLCILYQWFISDRQQKSGLVSFADVIKKHLTFIHLQRLPYCRRCFNNRITSVPSSFYERMRYTFLHNVGILKCSVKMRCTVTVGISSCGKFRTTIQFLGRSKRSVTSFFMFSHQIECGVSQHYLMPLLPSLFFSPL